MRTRRVNFLDVEFDSLTFDDVRGRLYSVSEATRYAYVVTPNVDHVVFLHRHPELRELYENADLCVCDSRILRFLARLRGIDLPLVPGSDLAAALFTEVIETGDTIAVIGGTSAFSDQLRAEFPHVNFAHHMPPMNLRNDAEARRLAAAFIASSKARFILVAVGSPQQEMIANEVRKHAGASGVALCIGAGLEFLTGEQKRAPRLVRSVGLEWAHRLASNPRRLWRRYLVDGWSIFPIYLRWRNPTRRMVWPFALFGAAATVAVGIYAAQSYTQRQPGAGLTPPQRIGDDVGSIAIKLPPPDLLRPLTPEQAVEENAERPFVNRPDTPAGKFVLRTDATDRDRALTCLTQAVYYEAAGEGVDGGRAVAQVVLNRMRHPGYPASVCGVVYQGANRQTGCQFSFTCDGSLLRAPVAALWARSRKIAEEALKGRVFVTVGHATHYHADYVLPYWADSLDKTVQIGRHIFYRFRSTPGESRSFFQRYAGAEPDLRPPVGGIVLPPSEATEQLATALISDGLVNGAKDVEKATPGPTSPLLIDSSSGTLLADAEAPPVLAQKRKPVSDCDANRASKRLTPLGPNDVRATTGAPGC